MSLTAVDPAQTVGAGASPAIGAQAAASRVAELQQLIAEAQGQVPSNGGASFPVTLAGAGGPAATAASFGSAAGGYPAAGLPSATAVVPANVSGGAKATPYDGLVTAAAQRYGLDPAVLHGLIQQESGFDPTSHSSAGALGLTQLMPGTASSLGVTNPLDPAQSIDGGAHYLREQLDAFGGDVVKALAAYNAGPGAVKRYGGVPPYAETQDYVTKVLGYANAYRSAAGASPTTAVTA